MDDAILKLLKEKERQNLFTFSNHIEMVSVDEQGAVFRLTIRPESKNGFGTVHGGALYAMADNAAGFAVHMDGRQHVTQSGSLNFLHNRGEGTIFATARVRHRGRVTSLVAVDVTAEDGTLLATGEFTFFCVEG